MLGILHRSNQTSNIISITPCFVNNGIVVFAQNLKGIFVKEVLDMYANGLCTEEEFQKAIEIGLEAM